ncbi:hypothetical protein [Nocardia terpenica]|uniref:Uncharacterized protein n=1 Tax=Nocardia terpenica TaxID=455432 RepID=A0A6G9ZAR5_9NOCA|nr:hypothetical protein [Nocardia terpenica]QIS22103.1 hypothetical protein F6W96_30920 [Nocardia terpenica]
MERNEIRVIGYNRARIAETNDAGGTIGFPSDQPTRRVVPQPRRRWQRPQLPAGSVCFDGCF